jgi:DNA helicase-2/ATP-dependent DNA helicase PcrA
MTINLNHLNEAQKEAVESVEGPVLILAGAGSGKTRTLTYRIAYLIEKHHAKPADVLAVTFTNKAAREMKSRVDELVKKDISSMWIGTFHSICARMLRIEAESLGFSRNYTIYDVDDQVRAIKKVISTLNVPQQLYSAKYIQSRLSRIKNQLIYASEIENIEKKDGFYEYLPGVYREYQKYLRENNALDFDDLLIKPIELFDNFPDIRKKYSKKFKYVFVDEYQDTNKAQYLFVQKLVEDHKNICVVGDEDQSIYGWRGADLNNILNFSKDFKNAKVFKLEENYRSNKYILEASNAVVQHNQERICKSLWTNRDEGDRIKVYAARDDLDEAKHIVEMIHDEMYTKKRSFRDIAVLYRTNAQSRIIEDALRKNAISYNIVGSVKFYDRKEIKDIIAYLKIIVNSADSISLKRVVNFPLRGIGDTTISKIEKFAEVEGIHLFDAMGRVEEIASISPAMSGRVIEFYQLIKKFIGLSSELSVVELVSTLTSETGIMHHYKTEYDQYESESRVANIKELFNSIEQFSEERAKEKKDNSLTAFLEEVTLLTDVDTWNANANAVTLMTLHAAKGLEFPVIFITGLEMNLLPLQRSSANIRELEEERRLLYVGMTRAQENLYLSYAVARRKYNQTQSTTPSLFLDELPQELIEYSTGNLQKGSAKKGRGKSRKKKIESYFDRGSSQDNDESAFKIGQPVYHATFGKGQVLNVEGSGDKAKITVHFKDEDIVKKLIKQYANLSAVENS